MANGLKQMEKLVDSLIQRQDSGNPLPLHFPVPTISSRTRCCLAAGPGPFRDPVNYRELGLFDYPDIVKRPMCLTDVKVAAQSTSIHIARLATNRTTCSSLWQRNLVEGSYRTVAECAEDIRLIWDNCMLYNQVRAM